MEEQLAGRADLVFVTSPDLLERKRALNQSIVLVPNAVDYDRFAAAADCSSKESSLLTWPRYPHPLPDMSGRSMTS